MLISFNHFFVARREINKILERTCERRHTLRDPGIKSYYLGDEGKEFLETTSRVNNCVILLNSPSCEEWIQYAREHQNEAPFKKIDDSSSVVGSVENICRSLWCVQLQNFPFTLQYPNTEYVFAGCKSSGFA